MNSVAELLALRDSSYVILSKAVQVELCSLVLLYLFRGCEVQALNAGLKEHLGWSGQDCINFRKDLSQSGYVQKNLKLFTYAFFTKAAPKPEPFGVTPADVKFLAKLNRSKNSRSLQLVRLCRNYASKGFKPRSLEGFDYGLHKACLSLKQDNYCEKFVGKKFKFLTDTGQKDEESLIAEMFEFALRAAYRAYPEIEGLLHLTNIMKQAIHNRGINIIKEETTAKRARMVKNTDGTFNGVLLSLQFADFEQTFLHASGTASTCNTLMCGLDGSSADLERITDVDRRRDLVSSVDKLLKSCKEPEARKFVELLMGQHDKEFSDYLKLDNTEASYKLPRPKYIEHARRFLGMPLPLAKSYVSLWQSQLKDFRN